MSKFYNIEGQSVVVEGVLTESISNASKNWTLVPGESVGPIKIGMNREAVKALFKVAPKAFKKTKSSKNTTDDFKDFHVYYDEDNKVKGVEVFEGITITMNGKVIFPTSKDKAKNDKGYSYYIDGDDVTSIFCESTVITEAAKELDNPEKVFGKLTLTKYHTYDKDNCQINFFGKTYNVKLSIDAMSGNKITQKQADMFTKFNNESDKLSKQAVKALIRYIDGLGDYKDYFDDKELPKTEADMAKYVKPHSLLIDEERYLSLYCDTKWDPEHGVTIGLIPTVKCGDLGEFW